jgi:double-stranded uracil-DNA glycosylase
MATDHRTDRTVDLAALPPERWPLELADAHAELPVGAHLVALATERARLVDVLVGAGFAPVPGRNRVRARRLRSLADTVGPGLRLLVCGLNPSLYAADFGVGYGRPGNRFWPAVLEAGLATRDRDPLDALHRHGLGMTDLVKRATPTASELRPAEYVEGLARVGRLAGWLRPHVVCFVGLAGWRVAVDRNAGPGLQAAGIGGVPAYVMPSTSGANAASSRDDLVAHLRAVRELAEADVS